MHEICLFLGIIGFDQSSATDLVGNGVKVAYSACLAFSVECISPWDYYRSCSSKVLLFMFFSLFYHTLCAVILNTYPVFGSLFHSLPVSLNKIINRHIFKMSLEA